MESLCSPSQGSTCPRCGDPKGEGEAARALSTAKNGSGIIWVLIGMQELLRTHSGCEPALPGPWNIGIWISTGSGWAPAGSGCSIPVGMEAWLHTLDPELPVPPAASSSCSLGPRARAVHQDPSRNSLWLQSFPEHSQCFAHGLMIMEMGWVGLILTEHEELTESLSGGK